MPARCRLPLLLLLAGTPAIGATCGAIGRLGDNSAGFAIGGTTYSSNGGISIMYGAEELGSSDGNPCTDLLGIDSKLGETFYWAATCNTNTFE